MIYLNHAATTYPKPPGVPEAVAKAAEELLKAGAKRCVSLKVSGPFHSQLLKGAGEKLAKELEAISLRNPAIPYFSNVDALPVTESSTVKELLKKQVSHPVLWQQSMEKMLRQGIDTFVEIGPGKTLAGFMKKINRTVKVLNIEKLEDIEKAVKEFL